MKAVIHRGTRQIGGTCVELEQDGYRIVLDIGLPLDADETDPLSLLPSVSGLREADPSLLAVVISHPHLDHYGLALTLGDHLPLVMGKAAESIIAAAAPFVPNGKALQTNCHLENRKTIQIGPFAITPYLVDHSAFDAYALLVEAGGDRLFYTGDLRDHGRKGSLVRRLIDDPPHDIDVLLMEGTMLGRDETEEVPTETELENRFVDLFRATPGVALVAASAQNIDRVVTVFRAAKRSGRVLIIDLYAAAIFEATGTDSIPKSDWPQVRLFVPHWQRLWIKKKRAVCSARPAQKEPCVFRSNSSNWLRALSFFFGIR